MAFGARPQAKQILVFLGIAGLVVFGGRELLYARQIEYSSLLEPMDERDMTKAASLVATGTVEKKLGSKRITGNGGLNVTTRWVVRPDAVLKGTAADTVMVRTIGGRVGLTEVIAEDQAIFTVGEKVFLFLEPGVEAPEYQVVGGFQGHYTVIADGAGNYIARQQASNAKKSLAELLNIVK